MALDIKLNYETEFGSSAYKFGIVNGDIESEDGLDSAIYISLLSDQRASADQISEPSNRRGWLGDLATPVDGRLNGSLLWLVDQARLNQDTLNRSINYAQLALNWMVEDSIAKSVTVTGSIIPRTGIQLVINIVPVVGETTNHYVNLWELTGNAT